MAELGHGSRVGDYILDTPIGRGAYGQVWRAHHGRTNEAAAVKILAAEASSAAVGTRVDLERLAAAAARDSTHVVRVLASGQDPAPYLAMEYVAGSNLRDVLRQRGPLPQAEVIAIGLAIADALRALHRVRIVHRDVKPANVLLDPAGSVKLTDFGVARIIGYEETVTLGDHAPLSAPYAAPEAWDGAATERSDLYALGVVLFELLTGTPPFTGELLDLYRRHHFEEPDFEGLPADTAPSLRELIRLCLKKSGSERPAGAAECVRLLERAEGELRREPVAFGPWVLEERHPTQPWAWRCRHDQVGETATVELIFSNDDSAGAAIRAAIAANPALVPLGGERLLGTNRLLLAEGEGWATQPEHNVVFWVARAEEDIPAVTRAIGIAQLTALAASLESLVDTASAAGVRLAIDANSVVIKPDWQAHLRRPGLPPPPQLDSGLGALRYLQGLPNLTAEAAGRVAGAASLGELLQQMGKAPEQTLATPGTTPAKASRVSFPFAALVLAVMAVAVVAAVFLLSRGGNAPAGVALAPTASPVPTAVDSCTTLKLPASLEAVRSACPGANLTFTLDPSCPRAMACSLRRGVDGVAVGENDLVAAVVDENGKLQFVSPDRSSTVPGPELGQVSAQSWSPDGRYLAVVTSQRFPSDNSEATASRLAVLEASRPANYGTVVALTDVLSSPVHGRLTGVDWTRDGRSLYSLWQTETDASVLRVDLPAAADGGLDFARIRSNVPPAETLMPAGVAKLALNFRDFDPNLRPAAFEVAPDGSLLFHLCAADSSACSLGRWDGVTAKIVPAGRGASLGAPLASGDRTVTLRYGPGNDTHVVAIGRDGSAVSDVAVGPGPAGIDSHALKPLALVDGSHLVASTADGRMAKVSLDDGSVMEWGRGSLVAWYVPPAGPVPASVSLPAQPFVAPTPGPTPTPPVVATTPITSGNVTDLGVAVVRSSCASGSELKIMVTNLGPGSWVAGNLFVAVDSAATGSALVSNKAISLAALAPGQSQELATGYSVQERVTVRIDSVGTVNDPNRSNNRADCGP